MLRTPLFVPATHPERFQKAANSRADAVILDLEDSVADQDKARARENLVFDLPCKVVVRVNAAQTRWHLEDLKALVGSKVSAIMLPKAQSAEDFTDLQRVFGMSVPVIALVETAAGLAAARELAHHPLVTQLAFGSVDYCANLGCAHSREALLAARSELVLASKLAGIAPPLDGVTTDLSNSDIASDDARHGRALGMGGKMCIHPKQVEPANAAFRPTPDEIEWARRVTAAGDGVVAMDGEMVDAPVRLRAAAILDSARLT